MAKIPAAVPGYGFCPLLRQGCIGEGCAWWIKVLGKDGNGDIHEDEECAINWTVLLSQEQLRETARVTAGHDKVANETSKLAGVFAIGVQEARQRAIEGQGNGDG